jgi:hypothetical protein
MRKRRKLALIAVGVALLILVGWFLATWVLQAGAHGSGPTATATAAMESGDSSETTEPARSHPREAQGNDEQIRSRVESMLNIKPNEIAIITVPKTALEQCVGQWGALPMPDMIMTRGLVTKGALKGCLEGVLKAGEAVKAKIGDHAINDYSGNEFQMKIEVLEASKDESIVTLRTKFNGKDLLNRTSLIPGFGLVYQLPAPSEEGIVILIGSNPSPATATTKP